MALHTPAHPPVHAPFHLAVHPHALQVILAAVALAAIVIIAMLAVPILRPATTTFGPSEANKAWLDYRADERNMVTPFQAWLDFRTGERNVP